MPRVVVGTTPVLLANDKIDRALGRVLFQPVGIASGNSGRVHVAKGHPPVATVGAPNQGDILLNGEEWETRAQFQGDPSVWKGQIWAVAQNADQELFFEEA